MDDTVRCPNLCIDGYVKHFPDPEKALFVMIKCEICKGTGIVNEENKIIKN